MKKKSTKSNLIVSGLLDFLSETGDDKILPEITNELNRLLQESKKADTIIVTTCIPLSSFQHKSLCQNLKKILHTDLPIKNLIDKKLIGGFTIKVGNWFLDASIAKEITNIRNILINN